MINRIPSSRAARQSTIAVFLLVLATCTSLNVQAEEPDWALTFGVGANYSERASLHGAGTKVDYDLGLPRWHGGISRRLGENWWLGAELSQRKTKAEFIIPPGNGPSLDPGASDKFSSADFFLSITRDFSIGPWLKPYLKFGVGPTWVSYRLSEQGLGGVDPIPLIDDTATAVAFQGSLGFRFPVSRSLDLGIAYEYWRAPDIEFETIAGVDVDLDQTMHSGWLDLTYYPGAARSAGFRSQRANGPAPNGFYYLSGGTGVAWVRDTETAIVTFDALKPGGLLSFAFGRTLGRRWRAEVEYAFRSNEAELVDFGFLVGEQRVTGDFSSSSFALNLHYELFPEAPIRPSIGFGFGTTSLKYDMDFFSDGSSLIDDTVNTDFWQSLIGFNVEISRNLTLNTSWRMWKASKAKLEFADGSRASADQWVHSAEFSLRYTLGH